MIPQNIVLARRINTIYRNGLVGRQNRGGSATIVSPINLPMGSNMLTIARARLAAAALVGLVFFATFAALGSRQFVHADGTLRCLDIYYRGEIFFHGNNHLLYPLHVYGWHKLLSLLGVQAASAVEFMRLTQVFNSLIGALALALYYWLVQRATQSYGVALAATVGYGFSRAFLLHATNSAEPLPGLLWSLLAITMAVVAIERGSYLLIYAAGMLLALTMASYQSMTLAGPIVLFIIWRAPAAAKQPLAARLGAFLAGCLIGTVVIYGAAYAASGTTTLTAMLARFFSLKGRGVYASFGPGKIFAIAPGIIINIFSPMRIAFIVALALPIIILLVLMIKNLRNSGGSDGDGFTVKVGLIGFVITLAAPAYWMPGYDKIFLQPLAALFFLSAALFSKAAANRALRFVALAIIALIVGINLSWAIPARVNKNLALEGASEAAKIVKAGDLVINDWDDVSLLYGSIYSAGARVYNFPGAAEELGAGAITDLKSVLREYREKGSQIYFLGILDETERDWNVFLAQRGVPFSSFEHYRNRAEVVARYTDTFGRQITLRRLNHRDTE